METILVLLAALLAIDLIAWKRGFDSRDSIDNPEWERLRNWAAFH